MEVNLMLNIITIIISSISIFLGVVYLLALVLNIIINIFKDRHSSLVWKRGFKG